MAWKVDDAAAHPALRDVKIWLREVSFHLGVLAPRIRIRLFRRPGDIDIHFEQSHFLKPPNSSAPLMPPNKTDTQEGYVLFHAVQALTQAYESALAAGHAPEDSWLVPNANY